MQSFARVWPLLLYATMRSPGVTYSLLCALSLATVHAGCGVEDEELSPLVNGGSNPGSEAARAAAGAWGSGLRRLSRTEYDDTLADLLGDTTRSGFRALPEDVNDPFDNGYMTQLVSPALIEAADTLAAAAAQRAVSDAKVLARIVPCQPTSPTDDACLKQFIGTFGRRALRRPLTAQEVDEYATLGAYSRESGKFETGVELVLRAMLQDVSFLYRVEAGTPVADKPGVYKLDDFEVATRLSYFLWGTTPNDALLDIAAQGKLSAPDAIRAAAATMMTDPRARARVQRFHALWLGYHQLPHAAELTSALRAETEALVSRVIFEKKGSYLDLFTAKETFITPLLASHYGLPAPTNPNGDWVSYAGTERMGILSHGSVLSAGAKFADTSPTQRGKFVRNRLFCEDIPPPPPNVNADLPPGGGGGSTCKIDRYKTHANVGSCKGCHSTIDPIGFGLEAYDTAGRFRATELDRPDCPVDGNGEVEGVGAFHGPGGLAQRIVDTGIIQKCVVRQLARFALGRREAAPDEPMITELQGRFAQGSFDFQSLVLDVVASDGFGYRKED